MPWACPVCQRSVPDRVAECYCGVRKGQVRRPNAPGAGAPEPVAASWAMRIAAFLAVLAAGAALGRWTKEEPEPPPPPPGRMAPIRPARPGAVPLPAAPPATPAPQATLALPFTTHIPSPQTRPSPAEPEAERGVDGRREAGVRALEDALQGAVSVLRQLEPRLEHWRSHCLGQVIPACLQDKVRLQAEVAALSASLEQAEEAARRSWVQPGDVRGLRARHLPEERLRALLAEAEALR